MPEYPDKEAADKFEQCAGCPSLLGCSAASYCLIESRFHYPNRDITAPVCKPCGRPANEAWACQESRDPGVCAAQSDLWGQWFLVQMYARDEKERLETAGEDDTAERDGDDCDDDEPCYHEHDEECYDYQDFLVCTHTHCWNCGGCRCPGYCDDHQTYNLRPDETGGASDG